MEFLPEEIASYSLTHTEDESKLLKELNRETYLKVMNPRMLSGHLQGRVLSMISNMIEPEKIIEIGTYTGYSALCLSEGLKNNGQLHTIDINEEYASIANKYFIKSKWKNNIIQHIGSASEIIPKINQKFQLAFIDADKENYINYIKLIFEKIDVGGYIIADNVLWSGKIINKEQDEETKALANFNTYIKKNSKLKSILLPIRDGLMISKKIKK